MDYNFFNLRIIKLPDVTDDENPDILVYTYPGRRSGEYKPAKQGLYLIDSSNGPIKQEKESIDLNYVNKLVTVKIPDKNNNTYIFIPQGKSGSVEEIDVSELLLLILSFTRVRAESSAYIELSSQYGAPGTVISISGYGFAVGENVTITLGSTYMGSFVVDTTGEFSGEFLVPAIVFNNCLSVSSSKTSAILLLEMYK